MANPRLSVLQSGISEKRWSMSAQLHSVDDASRQTGRWQTTDLTREDTKGQPNNNNNNKIEETDRVSRCLLTWRQRVGEHLINF